MKQIKIKVFDAYIDDEDENYYKNLGISDFELFEYHNKRLDKNGLVAPSKIFKNTLLKIKPLDKNVREITKYELESDEKETLKMLKDTEKKAEKLLDSVKRKRRRYRDLLLSKLNYEGNLYEGEYWDCDLSPFGYCIYNEDCDCIFCGEPEDRK